MIEKAGGALLAVIIGLAGAVVLFWLLDRLVHLLPGKWEERLKPYAYLLPAVAAIGLFLIYPAVTTVYASFLNDDSTEWVGVKNYVGLFGSEPFLSALVNNVLWIVFVPASIVALGMLVAVLADKMHPTGEKIAKSFIFLPMAISMVGASTIWRFIYAYRPEGEAQVGVLNAIVMAFGGEPQAWLQIEDFRFNTALLMIVYIWTQVGYAMVLLSAAIKAVPEDTIEAGRIDGAGEVAIFFRIIVPQAWPTVITVFITVLIGVMKVFDIVFAMTNGNFNTDVIGNAFFNALFFEMSQGRAAAIVVVLMVAVIPIMVYQVRQFRKQEANS
ncbi:carbohydrate ABC transporter permease [Propionicicella superfundia]|uniref:carbohydrate ABC transporter permease n=1 Tax=Propionicicella superfundia TaxID=348582 RepID=UPI0003F6885B|nr:sugar ABC transporter permease [Propionicicella superfundia]